ncbi:translation initiation factor IF-2 N-terminal domain-containing protein [Hydrogenophaga laconesensis]|jgi:hypothetical protein|uniref:Translation initiation factor IF-2 N-terminal domain-containing protein n=1 Tax=Hydrogenophaga laconesensis TaxID=1805971 RepID=A0ABU1V904_9BURK|nr:hypothetical protein [Hydrogenophaga laconesensis]MDR7093949.1 hypothetical protein [Hydrogenophaga laconesensis]
MLTSVHVDPLRPHRELLVRVRGRLTRIFPELPRERFDESVAIYTVADFADELGKSPDVVLEQLRAAGVHKQSAQSPLLYEDKRQLLAYLRDAHGATGERKKITLKKGGTRAGRGRPLLVESEEWHQGLPASSSRLNKVILVGTIGRQPSDELSASLLLEVFRTFHGRNPVWFEARILRSYEGHLKAIREAVEADDKAATVRAIQRCFEGPDSPLTSVVARAVFELVSGQFSSLLAAQVSIAWESQARQRAPRKLKTGRLRADNTAAALAASWLKRYKRLFPASAATISLT